MVERFQRDPAEVGRARGLVRRTLRAWGLYDEVEALELGVSELVTNAIMHGEGVIEVRLAANGTRVRLEVSDEGRHPVMVRARQPGDLAVGGWGLRLVEHEVDRWGTADRQDRTVVWAEKRTDGTRCAGNGHADGHD